jgi:hypothetical protein
MAMGYPPQRGRKGRIRFGMEKSDVQKASQILPSGLPKEVEHGSYLTQ